MSFVVGFRITVTTGEKRQDEALPLPLSLEGKYYPDGQYNGKTAYVNPHSSATMYFDEKVKQWKLNDKDDKETYLWATDDVPAGRVPWFEKPAEKSGAGDVCRTMAARWKTKKVKKTKKKMEDEDEEQEQEQKQDQEEQEKKKKPESGDQSQEKSPELLFTQGEHFCASHALLFVVPMR